MFVWKVWRPCVNVLIRFYAVESSFFNHRFKLMLRLPNLSNPKAEMDSLYPIVMGIIFHLLLLLTGAVDQSMLQDTKDELMQLNFLSVARVTDITLELPDLIREHPRRPIRGATATVKERKRGNRGGVRLHLKKQRLEQIPLPPLILANVQSLRGKLHELQGNVRYQKDFKDCGVLAFTESWLTEDDRDNDLALVGFETLFRLDRQAEVTGKRRWGMSLY